MSLETLRQILLWCGIINYAFLGLWVLIFLLARDGLHRLTSRVGFRISSEQFDSMQYAGMLLYKLGIFFFYLIPWVVLRFVV